MKTRKPISSISYNTDEFLKMKLEQFISQQIISFYLIIKHFPEEDEKKEHKHIFMVPNGQLDTMNLQKELREFVPEFPDKPLGCIDFRSSDPDHWILYNEHYEPYLVSKMESRKYHYTKDDFITSDYDTFDFYYHHAFYSSDWAKDNQILKHINSGGNPAELISNGSISWKNSGNLLAFMRLKYGYTDRGYRKNHEDNEFCKN